MQILLDFFWYDDLTQDVPEIPDGYPYIWWKRLTVLCKLSSQENWKR